MPQRRAGRLAARWGGLVISLAGIVAVLVLAVRGDLGLYIHPRYFTFTVVMAFIALVVALGAIAVLPGATDTELHAHGHDAHGATSEHGSEHEHEHGRRRTGVAVGAATAFAVLALVIVPPSTLSSATAIQRDIAGGTGAAASGSAPALDARGGETASYTVKDWVTLLRRGVGDEYLANRAVDVVGFVVADPADPENVFLVSRFVITCCAVDAQPMGLAVYEPGWHATLEENDWVRVAGSFARNPSGASAERNAVIPASIDPVDEPDQPYEY